MTTRNRNHLKAGRAKRGVSITIKKPADLKVRRTKRKLVAVRRQDLKNEPWYAAAAMRVGIKTPDQREKSPRS